MKKVKKGMTLLEVVISLAILAIMIIPLMNSLLTAVRANKKGEEVQDAKLLGQQFIEQLRLQEDINSDSITMNGLTVTLGSYIDATDSERGSFEVTSTEVEGFTIEGKIYEDDVVKVNESGNGKEYLDKKLGGLIVISKDKIKYYGRTSEDKSIKEIYSDPTSTFSDRVSTLDEVSIEFVDNGLDGTKKVFSIRLDGVDIALKTVGGVGVYIKEDNDFKFKINNSSSITQDVVVFRDPNVSQDGGSLVGEKLETKGVLNIYKNIIFDLDKSKTGLYTADLEIKKDGEKIEKIESQFYLGE